MNIVGRELLRTVADPKPLITKFAEAEHVAGEVVDEYVRARKTHPACHSFHEHFAVLLEEVDEYKAEVWKNSRDRDVKKIREELIQIAAMAIAGVVELCDAI